MVRFTIPAGHKAGACCAAESYRYALQGALVYRGRETGKAHVAATDGKVLSVLPLVDDGPEKALLVPAKSVNANGKPAKVEINGEIRKTEDVPPSKQGKTEIFPGLDQEVRWPPIRDVFPKLPIPDDCLAVTVDTKQLAKLASAIAPSGLLTLFIRDNKTAMLAIGLAEEADHGPTGLGLVMPFSTEAKDLAACRAYAAQHISEIPDGDGLQPGS